tara:strand:- start:477 stop:680 length:204 start_codon:yes stop_codon:yes gene_type:complete
MRKMKVMQKVYIPKLDKFGRVHTINKKGHPTEISIDGEIISTIGLVFRLLTLLEKIVNAVKLIFTKK